VHKLLRLQQLVDDIPQHHLLDKNNDTLGVPLTGLTEKEHLDQWMTLFIWTPAVPNPFVQICKCKRLVKASLQDPKCRTFPGKWYRSNWDQLGGSPKKIMIQSLQWSVNLELACLRSQLLVNLFQDVGTDHRVQI
jgi:hypothetical protein